MWALVFFLCGCAHVIFVLVTSIILFVKGFAVDRPDDWLKMPCYATILIVAIIFFAFFLWEGVVQENAFELGSFTIAAGVVLFFSVQRMFLSSWSRTPDDIVLFVASIVASVVYCVCSPFMYRKFGWVVFHKLGPAPRLQRMFTRLRFFHTLLNLDYFTHVILAVIALYFFVFDYETIIIIVAIVLLLGWVIFGRLAVVKELRRATLIFGLLGLVTPPYIIYKLVRLWIFPQLFNAFFPRYQAVIAGVAALLFRAAVLLVAWRQSRIYGQGLRKVLEGGAPPVPTPFKQERKQLIAVSKCKEW